MVTAPRGVDAGDGTGWQLAAVMPLLVVFAGTLIVVAGWVVGARPFWPVEDLTLSEAVLAKDAGEIVRLIEREGVDPNRAYPVRRELLDPPASVTPLEAAIIARRPEAFRLLLRQGAVLPQGHARTALICRGVAGSADEIVQMLLDAGDRSDPRGACGAHGPS